VRIPFLVLCVPKISPVMASAGRDQRRFQAAILGCVAGVMGECEQERLAGCSERPGVRYREPFIRAARKREDERARSVACAMRGNAKVILCRATRVQERRGARRATARSAAAPATMEAEEETREHGRGRDWSWTRLVVPLRLDTLRLQQRHGPPAAMHPARFCLATGLTGTTLASQRARKGWRPSWQSICHAPFSPRWLRGLFFYGCSLAVPRCRSAGASGAREDKRLVL
jgi:hypothetical protein